MLPIRVAQGSTAFFALAHTGGMLNTAFRDDKERVVIEALQSYTFPIMGVERSHHDFYQGMGFSLSLFLAFCVFLMQKLIPLIRENPATARSLLMGLSLTFVVMAAFCVQWFFPAPLVMSALTAAALAYTAWNLPTPKATAGVQG